MEGYCKICNKKIEVPSGYWIFSLEDYRIFGICKDCYLKLREKNRTLVLSGSELHNLILCFRGALR